MSRSPVLPGGPVLPQGHRIHCTGCNGQVARLLRDLFLGDRVSVKDFGFYPHPISEPEPAPSHPLSCRVCGVAFAHRLARIGLTVIA